MYELKEKALVQVDMGYLRKGDRVLLICREPGERALFYMAEVMNDGYYVKQNFGFRDTHGEHQKDRWVDVQIAGLWNSSTVWRSNCWEAWTSPEIKDRIRIDVSSNDRLREKRELEAMAKQQAKDSAKENADKIDAIHRRETQKRDLLRQVEVLNTKIKELD